MSFYPMSKYSPLRFLLDEDSTSAVWVGTMDGKPAWSEGRILILGECPVESRFNARDFSRTIAGLPENMVQIQPVAFHLDTRCRSVILFSNGFTAMADKFYKAILLTYPGATFWNVPDKPSDFHNSGSYRPVVVRSAEGERVAIIMPMLWNYGELADILSANAELHIFEKEFEGSANT